MIRTGITYRFKRRVTEAGAIRLFCGSSWWGGPEHGAGGAEKGAFFDFYGTITTSVSY